MTQELIWRRRELAENVQQCQRFEDDMRKSLKSAEIAMHTSQSALDSFDLVHPDVELRELNQKTVFFCKFCMRNMLSASTTSCDCSTAISDGMIYDAVPFTEGKPDARCPDCGVAIGGFHHSGCEQERCPKCDGQLISCRCNLLGVA